MVVWDKFIADSPEAPNKKLKAFLGLYSDKEIFLIWYYILLSPNEIYRNIWNA